MSLNFKKECPQCHEFTGEYHLMMDICDKCVNENSKNSKPEYIMKNGILVKDNVPL